jgi:trimethylamine:corrinoid methyltransferase-like protein
MPEPRGLEKQMRAAMLVVLLAIIVIAPLIGAFVISPFIVAWGMQPYPLAAAVSVMIAEALAIVLLAYLVMRSKK